MIPLRVENPTFSRPIVTWVLILINLAVFLAMEPRRPVQFQRHVFAWGMTPRNLFKEPAAVFLLGDIPIAAREDDGTVVAIQEGVPDWLLRSIEVLSPAELSAEEVIISTRRSVGPWWLPHGSRRQILADSDLTLDIVRPSIPGWASLFTSMFLHAGWLHLLGNLWFLLLFGPSVEDVLGSVRYLIFYVATGLAAAGLQIAVGPDSLLPMIGASGAISGVLGGFALRFPRAQVFSLIPLFMFITTITLPAIVFLGLYIGGQIVMGLLGLTLAGDGSGGGVAYFAHIGGFLGGLILMKLLPPTDRWGDRFSRRRRTTGRRFGYEYADSPEPVDYWTR